MSARRSHPRPVGRSRREVVTAVAVGVAILLVTAALVWILAPGSTSTPTVPTSGTPVTTAAPDATSATVAPATTDTTAPGG